MANDARSTDAMRDLIAQMAAGRPGSIGIKSEFRNWEDFPYLKHMRLIEVTFTPENES